MNALASVGAAIAKHPGLTTFAVGTTALVTAAALNPDHTLGGINLNVASRLTAAAGGVALLGTLVIGKPALGVGLGLVGAGLIGSVTTR